MSILNADDLRLSVTEQQQTMHSSSFNRTSTFFALQMNLSIVKYLIIHSVYSLWVQTFDNNRNITEIFFRESQPFWFVVMRSKASGWWKWSRDIWGTPLSMTFIMEEIFLCKHVFLIIGNVYRHKIHCWKSIKNVTSFWEQQNISRTSRNICSRTRRNFSFGLMAYKLGHSTTVARVLICIKSVTLW